MKIEEWASGAARRLLHAQKTKRLENVSRKIQLDPRPWEAVPCLKTKHLKRILATMAELRLDYGIQPNQRYAQAILDELKKRAAQKFL